MTIIRYVNGDVRAPIGDGKKFILQCVNDIGKMGAGVALAIMQKWPSVRNEYMIWYKSNKKNFKLGNIQAVKVEDDIAVINMIGQSDIKNKNGVPPIRYSAIEKCLVKVAELAKKNNASVHAPKFGADLAGGKWEKIEELIIEQLCAKDIEVTVYNWKKSI